MCYSPMNKAISLGIYFYQPNCCYLVFVYFFTFLDFLLSKVQEHITWKESNAMIGFAQASHYRINHI